MSYIKAETILPKVLIETIQQYVEGKSIYIPSKEKLEWGSRTEFFFIRKKHSEDTAGSAHGHE